jgi:hypothetical protein
MTDQPNAKNKLAELLNSIGHKGNEITHYQSKTHNEKSLSISNSTVNVTFPHGLILKGSGQANSKKESETLAAQKVLDQLYKLHPKLKFWDKLMVEAQRGDVLIKLGIYLSDDFKKPSDKALELQRTETNERLAKVYDQWIADKDPDLLGWGTHMDEHKKASVVEALIWRRFNKRVIAEGANEHLKTLIKSIDF